MPQQRLSDFVVDMEKAGMLVRVTEEKRVVLVENVKDCEFQFLANAYSNQDQTAWALGCENSETGRRMVELGKGRTNPRSSTPRPARRSSSPATTST